MKCRKCGAEMIMTRGCSLPQDDMNKYFKIDEECTQWECAECLSKAFLGVASGTVYGWRRPSAG